MLGRPTVAVTLSRSPRNLAIVVIVTAGALFSVTTMLARAWEEAKATRASAHLESGHRLASGGHLDGAIEQYRAALEYDRDNLQASRALALALLDTGRLAEAETYLGTLLQQQPTDGLMNRGMARIAAARGNADLARAHYQRAVYGQWPVESSAARIDTRFELHDYLRRQGAREEALAELIRLKAEVPAGVTPVQRRLASLLAEAGAIDEAIGTLQAASAAAPRDVELMAQLARVQVQAGLTRAARATLRRALDIAPRREDLRDQAVVVEQVLALDPTLPRLGLVTRIRRARGVLVAAVAHSRGCTDDEAPGAVALRKEAETRLRRRAATDAEAAEGELALAARLWSAAETCRASTPEARALTEILARVAVEPDPQP